MTRRKLCGVVKVFGGAEDVCFLCNDWPPGTAVATAFSASATGVLRTYATGSEFEPATGANTVVVASHVPHTVRPVSIPAACEARWTAVDWN